MAALTKAEQLSEAKKRVKEAFIIFEHKEGSKLVDEREVPTIVRSLGINPTTTQIQVLQQRIAASLPAADPAASVPAAPATNTATFLALEQCEGIIASWLIESKDNMVRDDYHTLMRALKALDPDGRGYIEAELLRSLLTTCEDGLSPEEINNMISMSADDEGRVLYQEYALKLATDGRLV